MNIEAIKSLEDLDPAYPIPAVYDFLSQPENREFLEYVYKDPFGGKLIQGDIDGYPLQMLISDMEQDISEAKQIHLWTYIPTCRSRCHFCQRPTIVLNPNSSIADRVFRNLVDYNIKEAKMWLEKLPSLAKAEIGEFNIFGGTPSMLPEPELRRLMDFYYTHFNFSAATLRFEGEPGTLNRKYIGVLQELGFSKISFGVKSFNDVIIAASGRQQTAVECLDTILSAREQGLDWVSVDLIYGLLGQTVDDVKYDMERILALDIPHVVCTKMHTDESMKARMDISVDRETVWHKKNSPSLDNMDFPGLGKQYQMRELIEKYLRADYCEHPSMYFHQNHQEAEKWKGLTTDLDKQYPEIAIGLGGSSKCSYAEATNITSYNQYKQYLDEGYLPIKDCRGITHAQREVNAFKMALSTLIPVDDAAFSKRFYGRSFFENGKIKATLERLQEKQLIVISKGVVTLTPMGVTLVEAIVNTQFTFADAYQE